jgi:nucleoside-triphosphatase THEP1
VSLSHDLAPVLGAIYYERDFDINSILRTVAKSLQVKGVKVGGVLQESEFRPNGCCAQLNIVDIRTGKTERITQDRGRESRGCKLDPRGLAAISHCITDAIDADVDLVIINKFGRAESEGDGLLSCIADALLAGVPILTTVREPYVAAWNLYHGGLAIELLPKIDAILQWYDAAYPHRNVKTLDRWPDLSCLQLASS